jgi:uncharacterized membrane protein/uncharacterized membrane protein YeaQ/YmgE (transglycosylase-associated protein family)
MRALTWILAGLLAGWLARRMMRGRSYGVVGDLLLGLIGGVVGGWVMHQLGVTTSSHPVWQAIVALIGAMLVIGVARLVTRSSESARRLVDETLTPSSPTSVESLVKRLGESSRPVLARLVRTGALPRDLNEEFEKGLTLGQRVADQVSAFGGSWTFIGIFMLFLLGWMVVNTEVGRPFDPYPFILLNLLLSLVAAMQAPVIMMSQNRQAAKDRLDAKLDYEVNLRAEVDIHRLHAKLDEARSVELTELLDLLKRQAAAIEELRALVAKREPGA